MIRRKCYEELGKRCVVKTESQEVFKKYTGIFAISSKGVVGYEVYKKGGIDSNRMVDFINKFINGKYKNKSVVLNPLISCDKCDYCKNGREHLCPKRTMVGMSKPYQREGGLAEYISIPDKNTVIHENDDVVFISLLKSIRKAEDLFQVSEVY